MGKTTALITGAARRIGRQIAFDLAEDGLDIVAHYRSSSGDAEELKDKLTDRGVKVYLEQADFGKEEDTSRFIPDLKSRVGKIDILVNNASVFPPGQLEDLEFKDLMENVKINSWAPFSLTRQFANRYSAGKIINLLDTRIAGYDWNHVGYYFSKVLLARMTKMLALKFAPDFTVNGVAPGLVIPPEGYDQSYLEERTDRVPLKRHGEIEDVGRAVRFLVNQDFITGQIVYVDGGRNLLHELEG